MKSTIPRVVQGQYCDAAKEWAVEDFLGLGLAAPLFPNLPISPSLCLDCKSESVLEKVDKVTITKAKEI